MEYASQVILFAIFQFQYMPRRKSLILLCLSLIAPVFLGELTLRIIGYKPFLTQYGMTSIDPGSSLIRETINRVNMGKASKWTDKESSNEIHFTLYVISFLILGWAILGFHHIIYDGLVTQFVNGFLTEFQDYPIYGFLCHYLTFRLYIWLGCHFSHIWLGAAAHYLIDDGIIHYGFLYTSLRKGIESKGLPYLY
jgi:hypothetical protein